MADVGDRDALRSAIGSVEDQLRTDRRDGRERRFRSADPARSRSIRRTSRRRSASTSWASSTRSRPCCPGMLERRRGHLLAVSSLAAFKGLPGESAYCASKAAVNAYMEGLRIAVRTKGVTVTTVCPGFVSTAMTPMESAHAVHDVGRSRCGTDRACDRQAEGRSRLAFRCRCRS